MTARDKFRKVVAEVLTDWRLGIIPPRFNQGAECELYKAGVAEIIELRLCAAYVPLFQGLERIKARVGILADLREDHFVPLRGHRR